MEQTHLALGFAGMAVGDQIERLDHPVHAEMQRARHVVTQNEQLGHPLRRDDVTIDLAVNLESRHGTEQRPPLVKISRALITLRPQHVVLHVKNPRRVVGPLKQGTEPDEVVSLVLQQGAERRTA